MSWGKAASSWLVSWDTNDILTSIFLGSAGAFRAPARQCWSLQLSAPAVPGGLTRVQYE